MAVQKATYKLTGGIVLTDAYVRIDNVDGNKYNMALKVGVYTSAQEAQNGTAPVDTKIYVFTADVEDTAENIYKQGYEYLKSTDDFADAIDV